MVAAAAAQLRVGEPVANAIPHAGEGTPITLRFPPVGTRLRIGLTDPDPIGSPSASPLRTTRRLGAARDGRVRPHVRR